MAIYELGKEGLDKIGETTFSDSGIREREDLQRILKRQIEVISPDTLVIAEEFGEWEESKRRIDLLGVDKEANLVVIELKRTSDGGHMELQAIRYAAMIANLTFERVLDIYSRYLESEGSELEAEESLLSFLDWEEVDEEAFAQEVKIVLASAEFSKEITSSVLWLNEKGLDIRCVRMRPYKDGGRTLIDVQTVIPLPETEQYQVQIKEKKQKERQARESNRDFSKFDLIVDGQEYRNLAKRNLMFHVVKGIVENGGDPKDIARLLPSRKIQEYEGELTWGEVQEELMKADRGGRLPRTRRFFCKEGEIFHYNGRTYVLSNQWGVTTRQHAQEIIDANPHIKMILVES